MSSNRLPSAMYWRTPSFPSISTLIRKYWFRIILIAFALYLLMEKDISFQLKMSAANLSSLTEDQSSFQVLPAKQFFSSDERQEPQQEKSSSFIETIFPIVSKTEIRDIEEEEVTHEHHDHQPSNVSKTPSFRNLTFVLSPGYARKHGIPQSTVDEYINKCRNYIKRFGRVAVAEMKKYGIPASITLAQGLLESDVGESRLATNSNNHFGIKCFSRNCHKGHCSNFTDDSHKDFFRNYKTAWESYRAHSIFLQGDRYKHLQKLGTTDYKGWATGLRKAGYATDKRYANKLIQIIEFLDLHEYDR